MRPQTFNDFINKVAAMPSAQRPKYALFFWVKLTQTEANGIVEVQAVDAEKMSANLTIEYIRKLAEEKNREWDLIWFAGVMNNQMNADILDGVVQVLMDQISERIRQGKNPWGEDEAFFKPDGQRVDCIDFAPAEKHSLN